MVVVRESPQSKLSPSKSLAQWPPRSPFECLSPSGREKWQQQRQRVAERTPSPSPLRRPMSSSRVLQDLAAEAGADSDDEEALELELREIEVKRKLKKLRDAKKADDSQAGSIRSTRKVERTDSTREPPAKLRPAVQALSSHRNVEVPLSPIRRVREPAEPVSPARARLGLTAAARAQDVSLKRARDGTQIQHTDSSNAHSALSAATQTSKPVSSFSQRLAKSQAEQLEQEGRNERIERARSKGFALGSDLSSSAAPRSLTREDSTRAGSKSRTERMPSPSKAAAPRSSGSARSGESRSEVTPRFRAARTEARPQASEIPPAQEDATMSDSVFDPPPPHSSSDGSGYDPFSGIHLSKRQVPHSDVARAFEESEIYTLPRLLKEVKAPDYDPPDCEADYIVLGILASKSTPYTQKSNHRTNDADKPQEDASAPRNKFMVLTLTDLKWTVDLFLFGSAFDQFWKLTPGTLLAIQNPAILPPKGNHHSGAFSLKLGSSEDRVMEIGTARDLSYCVSIKKDGQPCATWVDKRSSDICEFHLALLVDKSRKSRMEVNGMFRGGTTRSTSPNARGRRGTRSHRPGEPAAKPKVGTYSREHGQLFSLPSTGPGRSAASILDAEDASTLASLTSEESSRRRIAAAQRERDLASQLSALPSTIGVDYLRAAGRGKGPSQSDNTDDARGAGIFEEKKSARELGLLNNSAAASRLSPAKDRKAHFGSAAVGTSGRNAMGWGGHAKWGLLQPNATFAETAGEGSAKEGVGSVKSAMRGRSRSPEKKKARILIEGKGVRTPGRESLGMTVGEEDGDELDIV
ncbi:hypothetical protein B0A48_03991 [Cryoendolithus antarcticus]|uniref:Uncharacterized protein n=1 Tax=Cryoendolithus antarcticus TaxID=1507870 RepID=A0A1V8THG7_9PEZI|nr:hypothetical protein B0A48_03991 [Cryoendolithus antarcticus]